MKKMLFTFLTFLTLYNFSFSEEKVSISPEDEKCLYQIAVEYLRHKTGWYVWQASGEVAFELTKVYLEKGMPPCEALELYYKIEKVNKDKRFKPY